MRKRHKTIRNGVVVLSVLAVSGLLTYKFKVNEVIKETEYDIKVEQVALEEKQEKLKVLQEELDNMDSLEYIRKVAEEELGMIEKDAIVIRPKE